MEVKELIKKAFELDSAVEALEKEQEELKQKHDALVSERDALYVTLLTTFKEKKLTEEVVDDLHAAYFSKEDVTWLDDNGLLQALKDNGASKYIKVTTKTTTSIDKNALKKAFKEDVKLKEQYQKFYGTKLIEYVTVSTEENYQKMLEHINDNTKK